MHHIPREDRPAGMFSAHDREYLRDQLELDEANDRQKRYRLRRRIRQGIVDFSLLTASDRLSHDDFRMMFAPKADPITDAEFHFGVEDVLKTIYLGCRLNQLDFRSFLESAVIDAERSLRREDSERVTIQPTFDVEVSPTTDLEDARARLGRDEHVTPDEITSLILAGDLTVEELDIEENAKKWGDEIIKQGIAEPDEPSHGDLIDAGATHHPLWGWDLSEAKTQDELDTDDEKASDARST